MNRRTAFLAAILAFLSPAAAGAHGVTGSDAQFLQSIDGAAVGPFLYLGTKHMVTGYDHLLFLVGVEIGQMLALTAVLIGLAFWRTRRGFLQHAFLTNALLMTGGFLLIGYQLSGYLLATT